ncbi:hypothetical protein BGZ76_010196 [Entomortierella beljakovae]|nr:hypothetical protein BGZ76_010196 [Entomortierella beljakovae]
MDTTVGTRRTFGYSNSETPSFSSLPPSPLNPALEKYSAYPLPSIITTITSESSTTTDPLESPIFKLTSLPLKHADPVESKPTSPITLDTNISIPLRSSSITPNTSVADLSLPSPPPSPLVSPTRLSVYRSQPTSRCSSMNSSISFYGGLDHRSMPRASHMKRTKVTSSASIDKPLPLIPQAQQSQINYGSSKSERAAFLSSPPVRSQVAASLRSKSVVSLTSKSVSSLALPVSSPNMYTPQVTKSFTELDLSKKRWSNDSTRGLYGSAMSVPSCSPSTLINPRTSSSSSNGSSDFDGFDDPYESDSNEETIDSSMFNDYDFDIQIYPSLKAQSKKKQKSSNKSLFSFIMRK